MLANTLQIRRLMRGVAAVLGDAEYPSRIYVSPTDLETCIVIFLVEECDSPSVLRTLQAIILSQDCENSAEIYQSKGKTYIKCNAEKL